MKLERGFKYASVLASVSNCSGPKKPGLTRSSTLAYLNHCSPRTNRQRLWSGRRSPGPRLHSQLKFGSRVGAGGGTAHALACRPASAVGVNAAGGRGGIVCPSDTA